MTYLKSVVLLGGSFNPIHDGHKHILKQAMKQVNADEGWFILANQAPLKNDKSLNFETRAQFIEWMIEDDSSLKSCLIEKDLPIPNYTITTIKALKERYPQYQFYYLIGTDQGQQFTKWFEYQQILNEVTLLIYPRDGYDEPIELEHLKIEATEIDVSSTQIREHKNFKTHPKILRLIAVNGYYAQDRLRTHLKGSLVDHCIRVATLSKDLAKAHHLDHQMAYGLGIAHDLYKQMESQEMEQYLTEDEQEIASPIWHGFVSAKLHQQLMHVDDKPFYDALYHHTLGDDDKPYSQILFIADKCEPNRKGKHNQKIIDLAKKDLDIGFELCRQIAKEMFERKQNERNSKTS